MSEPNPYESPATVIAVDAPLMHSVATRLNSARRNPPTAVGALTTWPGVPRLVIVGFVGTLALYALTTIENSILTVHWPIGVACTVFGAILREIRWARSVVHIWPAQSEFINWVKVDQYSNSE